MSEHKNFCVRCKTSQLLISVCVCGSVQKLLEKAKLNVAKKTEQYQKVIEAFGFH